METQKTLNDFFALSDKLNADYGYLIPDRDNADTIEGEALRAWNRMGYRFYNDGDDFTQTGESGNEAYNFLLECSEVKDCLGIDFEELYSKSVDKKDFLYTSGESIFKALESKKGNYTANKNNIDMFDYEVVEYEYEDEDEEW